MPQNQWSTKYKRNNFDDNEKVIENLKCHILEEEDEDGTIAGQKNWFEDRVSNVPFGGRFPWWFPHQDNWGDDNENSGSRLVTAYMKIMGYPEVRKFSSK